METESKNIRLSRVFANVCCNISSEQRKQMGIVLWSQTSCTDGTLWWVHQGQKSNTQTAAGPGGLQEGTGRMISQRTGGSR